MIIMCALFILKVSWSRCDVCDDLERQGQRGQATVGPARRIAEDRFIIITGQTVFSHMGVE